MSRKWLLRQYSKDKTGMLLKSDIDLLVSYLSY